MFKNPLIQVADVLDQEVYHRKPNSVKGGVGGMGKTARYFLRRIKDNAETFQSVFNEKSGKFIIGRKGGKKQIKTCLYRYIEIKQKQNLLKVLRPKKAKKIYLLFELSK